MRFAMMADWDPFSCLQNFNDFGVIHGPINMRHDFAVRPAEGL